MGTNKSRGRPPADTELLRVRVPRETLKSLDVWIAEQPDPKPSRQDAVRVGLYDWLTGMGITPQKTHIGNNQ